ncbi:type II toxin-antitoxin system VapC family toxin [soil metagenome]
MALLLDSDVLIELERGAEAAALDRFLGDDDRTISVITVSELLHGVLRASGPIRTRRRAFVEHLLAGLEAIPITEPVARIHAEIWADLAQRGEVIGAHDLWIAATAIAHGLTLATGNTREFERIQGLRLL